MPYPTGDTAQPDSAIVTLTVPVDVDDKANDYVLDAIVGSLTFLTTPQAWNADGHTQTPDDASAYAQMVIDSLSIVW